MDETTTNVSIRDDNGRLLPGHKLNAGGTQAPLGIRTLSREKSYKALEILERIMLDEDTPAQARISAANSILDRGWGRPKMMVETTSVKGTVQDWLSTLGDGSQLRRPPAPEYLIEEAPTDDYADLLGADEAEVLPTIVHADCSSLEDVL